MSTETKEPQYSSHSKVFEDYSSVWIFQKLRNSVFMSFWYKFSIRPLYPDFVVSSLAVRRCLCIMLSSWAINWSTTNSNNAEKIEGFQAENEFLIFLRELKCYRNCPPCFFQTSIVPFSSPILEAVGQRYSKSLTSLFNSLSREAVFFLGWSEWVDYSTPRVSPEFQYECETSYTLSSCILICWTNIA